MTKKLDERGLLEQIDLEGARLGRVDPGRLSRPTRAKQEEACLLQDVSRSGNHAAIYSKKMATAVPDLARAVPACRPANRPAARRMGGAPGGSLLESPHDVHVVASGGPDAGGPGFGA